MATSLTVVGNKKLVGSSEYNDIPNASFEFRYSTDDNSLMDYWYGIAYGNGLYVASGYGGNKGHSLGVSNDGIKFVQTSPALGLSYEDIVFINGRFYVCGSSAKTKYSSTNGTDWTLYGQNESIIPQANRYRIIDNKLFICSRYMVVCDSPETYDRYYRVPGFSSISDIVEINGRYVIGDLNTNKICYSDNPMDDLDWRDSVINTESPTRALGAIGGKFIKFNNAESFDISDDGETWTFGGILPATATRSLSNQYGCYVSLMNGSIVAIDSSLNVHAIPKTGLDVAVPLYGMIDVM